MNSTLVISAQQSIRYTDSFLIGNIIKHKSLAPVPSDILGYPDETLYVWIEFPNGEAERM